jgi:hypothetical protein
MGTCGHRATDAAPPAEISALAFVRHRLLVLRGYDREGGVELTVWCSVYRVLVAVFVATFTAVIRFPGLIGPFMTVCNLRLSVSLSPCLCLSVYLFLGSCVADGSHAQLSPPQAIRALFDTISEETSWTNSSPSVIAYAGMPCLPPCVV